MEIVEEKITGIARLALEGICAYLVVGSYECISIEASSAACGINTKIMTSRVHVKLL